ncbi:MAG: acyloxyacyl hydrolase [Bacteroidaceae bacterium]|nr:acyloxyacyl hydrolase [Bacteroidaceae bacterium]
MVHLYRNILLLVLVSVSFAPMRGAEDADSVVVDTIPKFLYSIGGSGGMNHLLNIKMRGEKLVKRGWGANYSLFMNSQANPLDSAISVYDRVFGFPTLEAGVQLLDYSHARMQTEDTPYMSRLGYVWAAYIGFRRDIYRNRKWSFGYGLENGLSYCSRPYNPVGNGDNDLIGQHLSLYFGFGVFGSYRVTPQTELSLGFEYKHNSNSATDRPNKGSNSYGLTLRARCDLNRPEEDKGLTYRQRLAQLEKFRKGPYDTYLYLDIDATVGFRTLYEEWLLHRDYLTTEERIADNNKLGLHTVWSTGLTPMVRYNQVHASGLGLEYSFGGYVNRSAVIEKQCRVEKNYRHSKHTLYISAHHEVYYKQLSLAMSVGTYLFRQHGWVGDFYEPPLVETVGLRYYPKFFKPFYLGYNVKANLGKAYALELKVGMHAGHWRLKKKVRKE